jgi:hypothetical protein
MIIKRILMTAADSGGASAIPPAAAPAPTPAPAPAAQAGTAAPGAQPDVAALIAQASQAASDKVFADLRRAGVLGPKPKAPASGGTPEAPQQQPTPDVDLRSLDRVLSRTGHATRLSESQYRRVEQAFRAEAPTDTEQWVKDYFEGWASASTAPAAPASASQGNAAPPQRTGPPVSDVGNPPAPTTPLEERPILSMTAAERQALLDKKGAVWYRDTLAKQSKGAVIKLR